MQLYNSLGPNPRVGSRPSAEASLHPAAAANGFRA